MNREKNNQLFLLFRATLDEKNEQRERIITFSKNVTRNSKKIIFTCARAPFPFHAETSICKEIQSQIKQAQQDLKSLAKELQHLDYYRFHFSITHGLQEFVEAICTFHFLLGDGLIGYFQIKELYLKNIIELTVEDYLLGVCDTSGELMKIALQDLSKGHIERMMNFSGHVRQIVDRMRELQVSMPCLNEKVDQIVTNAVKVENTCYEYELRRLEFSDGQLEKYLGSSFIS